MRRLVAATIVLCAATAPVRADVLSFTGAIQGGAAMGKGVGGDHKDEAFFDGASGGVYGLLVGVEALFIDVWIEHDQYRTGDGLVGTWTQFMVGADLEFEVGGEEGDTSKEDDEEHWRPGYVELGMATGFGVGTGQQVMLPLSNDEVSDKGFLFQVSAGGGYRFNRALSLGVTVPVQIGYMFKSGPGATANDLSTHYSSIQGAAMLTLRLKIGLM